MKDTFERGKRGPARTKCAPTSIRLSPRAKTELERRAVEAEITRSAILEELLRPELERRLAPVIPETEARLKAIAVLMESAPEEVAQLCIDKYLPTLEAMFKVPKYQ